MIDLRKVAADAYVFGYPLVLMNFTQTAMARGKLNVFSHVRAFPDPTFTDVVSPNADTLYSTAWLDLGKEPVVLSVPDTLGRYYLMPMLDAWSNVFASPGKRTTGTGPGHFAIVGPHWEGELPPGVEQIQAPTQMVWILGRTQTNGVQDFKNVHAIQDGYRLTSLSAWGKSPEVSSIDYDSSVPSSPPSVQVAELDGIEFFEILAQLMGPNPPAEADAGMIKEMREIGLVPGQPFAPAPELLELIEAGAKDGLAAIVKQSKAPLGELVNGWFFTNEKTVPVGSYGTEYLLRSAISLIGLGANLLVDAMYPFGRLDGENQPLDGKNSYVVHFGAGQIPPVNAFWSLTLYNDKQAFVANPINRYAIGDRDELQLNADGSLDLLIQNQEPGSELRSNWLPAPEGSFNLILRMYWPKPEALSGAWKVPAIRKTAAGARQAA